MDIREQVYALLERITLRRRGDIHDGLRLDEDLQMDSDDFGLSFVPRLEKAIGVKRPIAEWNRVVTVGDVIRLLEGPRIE